MEQQIKIAAKLYKCRDTAKWFWGVRYREKIEEGQQLIRAAMKRYQTDEMKAAIELGQHLEGNGMAIMIIMAALVEMLEPSKMLD
jgi:hypothetical protein